MRDFQTFQRTKVHVCSKHAKKNAIRKHYITDESRNRHINRPNQPATLSHPYNARVSPREERNASTPSISAFLLPKGSYIGSTRTAHWSFI